MNAEREPGHDPHAASENAAIIEATQPAAPTRLWLPEDALILVPVRNLVLFPGLVAPINIGRERTIAAAQEAVRGGRQVGVILQRDVAAENPGPDQLHRIGTAANVLRYVTAQDNEHYIVCQGYRRFGIIEFLEGYPFQVARVQLLPEGDEKSAEVQARLLQLRQRSNEILSLLPQIPSDLAKTAQSITSASAYADFVAGLMDIGAEEKQDILETLDLSKRLDKVLHLLTERIEVLRLSQKINQETRERMDERQREYLLREQLKTIQKELGETEGENAEVADLAEAIAKANMPPEIEAHAKKELKRLERMSEAAAEYSMLRAWLEWMAELPWSTLTEDSIDLPEASRILDEDHFGLEKVKRRILEYLVLRPSAFSAQ